MDPRYINLKFISETCSAYQKQGLGLNVRDQREVSLVETSEVKRVIKIKYDTAFRIVNFTIEPLWFSKGGYNSSDRPLKTNPELDLVEFEGNIYQKPDYMGSYVEMGYSRDKQIYFEVHLNSTTNALLGIIVDFAERDKILKYEAVPSSLKSGLNVLVSGKANMKHQVFNPDELSLFTLAFSKQLFILPERGEMFVNEQPVVEEGEYQGFRFYFLDSYFTKLIASMRSRLQGNNVETRWVSLMQKVEASENISNPNTDVLTEYKVLGR